MRIRKQKQSKKKLLIIGVAVLVAALGVSAWWYFSRHQVASTATTPTSAPTNTVNYGPATEQEKADSQSAKEDALNNASTDHPATSGSLSIVINRASQVGSAVSVRTTVTGTQDGTCAMAFTKGSQTVTKTFTVTQGPTAVSCNGDVPVSELGAGSWVLTVTAKNSSGTSAPAVQNVDITP